MNEEIQKPPGTEPRNPREWRTNVVNGEIQGSGQRITNVAPIVENNILVREVL